MNVSDLHDKEKPVSTRKLFTASSGSVVSLQLARQALLKEHMTKAPALLICIRGGVVFENENGLKESLGPGDYIPIEPAVTHWLTANIDSQLLLIQ